MFSLTPEWLLIFFYTSCVYSSLEKKWVVINVLNRRGSVNFGNSYKLNKPIIIMVFLQFKVLQLNIFLNNNLTIIEKTEASLRLQHQQEYNVLLMFFLSMSYLQTIQGLMTKLSRDLIRDFDSQFVVNTITVNTHYRCLRR